MTQRVAVFIDYQNVYMHARECFAHGSRSHVDGQVYPLRLGIKLCGSKGGRELVAVHVYRGAPSTGHDRRGYEAFQRQVDGWKRHLPMVQTHSRTL